MGIFSLKSSEILLALNAIKKKAPIINKTIEILNTTEKYDDRSLLFLEIAN
jgi:hypothetical protein